MFNRKQLNRRDNKRIFKQGAMRVHPKNLAANYVMRGGIRL